MEFKIQKIQELVIGILPNEVEIGGIELNPVEFGWYMDFTFCWPCTLIRCRERDDEYRPADEDLGKLLPALKKELKRRLDADPIMKDKVEDRLLPQSVKAVDDLRPKMLEVLVELEKRRAKLLAEGKLE
jgi:hypothetical protein